MQGSSEQGGGASEDQGLALPGAAPFRSTALGGQNPEVNWAFPGLVTDIFKVRAQRAFYLSGLTRRVTFQYLDAQEAFVCTLARDPAAVEGRVGSQPQRGGRDRMPRRAWGRRKRKCGREAASGGRRRVDAASVKCVGGRRSFGMAFPGVGRSQAGPSFVF